MTDPAGHLDTWLASMRRWCFNTTTHEELAMNEFEARDEVAYWQEMRAKLSRNVEIWRERYQRAQAAYEAALDAADAADAKYGSELEEAASKAAVWLRYAEEQRDMTARHHDDADLRVRRMTDGFIGGGE